jgi:hypothetical protein
MVVKRRPTCKPGELIIFDYPIMIGTEVVAIPSKHDPVGFSAEPPFKGEWTTHISYLNR